MKRLVALLPLAVLVLLAVLFAGYALKRDPNVQPRALVGKPVPALSLPVLETGRPEPVHPSGVAAPYLVNFFASWCAPCEVEHPVLMDLKTRGVAVVGIAYKDAPANTEAFLGRLGDPFSRRLLDRDGRAGLEFGVTGVPETYLVGANGVILAKHTGELTPDSARDLLGQAR